jgi:hypothetical protein
MKKFLQKSYKKQKYYNQQLPIPQKFLYKTAFYSPLQGGGEDGLEITV